MTTKTYKLSSLPTGLINSRFLVKASTFEVAGKETSILVSAFDVVEDGFTIKFFSNEDEAVRFINLIRHAY